MSDLGRLDATAQAELVRRGDATPLELVEAAIERIERVNPAVNAVITPLYDKARALAVSPSLPAGPFRGVPVVLKDIQPSAGDPMHCGMRFLRDLNWVEDHDATVVARLKQAGMVIVGKANLPELEGGITTEPVAYGATRNPWNLERSTGGSSGGPAAAVASGMVPLAHGTDSGGSIRIPASECGLVGLKPSRGRVSLGPDWGDHAAGAFCPHVLTRSVRDTAAVLDLLSGDEPGDPVIAPPPGRPFRSEVDADPGRLRIGLWTGDGAAGLPTHADCVAAAEDTAELLEDLGHHVERSHPKAIEVGSANIWQLAGSLFASYLDYWSERTGKPIGQVDVEPVTWALAEAGRSVSAADYIRAIQERDRFARETLRWWADGFDLLLTPTIAVPPPRLGECIPGPDNTLESFQPIVEAVVRFTSQFNWTGQPAVSLPLAWNEQGLPIGVQLVAAYAREDVLIRVAAQLERARPWADRRPRVHA